MRPQLKYQDFKPFDRRLQLAAETHYLHLYESGELAAADNEDTILRLAEIWPSAPKTVEVWAARSQGIKGNKLSLSTLTFTDSRVVYFILKDDGENLLSRPDPQLIYDLAGQLQDDSSSQEALAKLMILLDKKIAGKISLPSGEKLDF